MFKQYVLPYEYDALEPYIDKLTMETHYSKHHATYTKNLNDALAKLGIESDNIIEIQSALADIKDPALRQAVRNNGGGYYNHNLYFAIMSPQGGGAPSGNLEAAINKTFGSVEALKEKLTALALGQFGSGWAWLSAKQDGTLQVSASPNQDNPIIEGTDFTPILGIDVWEHAYYLKYKNLRGDYVKEFFNVVDWDVVAANYESIKK
ncbi:MAG TPA: superoxide dismutase [Candidatus Avacidaminococcus intestinavium]|uniref:Superoxide dismutase n=1 Tax=Candidatus Avacidaminococcus intestinavium TaxID=2840684 RepID=A0A9D1MMT9_9FIRM|nr:superoxide dismutase [Candidatus Avacidaminococcus intestinavium]